MERAVLVLPREGVFGSTCEIEDTPDPGTKVFRFKEGCNWGMHGDTGPRGPLRFINVYSAPAWISDSETFDPGRQLAQYRVTKQLETPPGYVGAYEGTTKPAPKVVEAPDLEAEKDRERTRLTTIEDAIILALDKGGRMVLSALKRKTHSYRFGEDWEKCLHHLAEQGELEIQTDGAGRQWVCTTTGTK